MKRFLLILLSVMTLFTHFAFSTTAKVVDTGLTINGSTVTLSSHIEYANGKYYISVNEFLPFGFTAEETAGEYVLTRYNKELRVSKNSSVVYKNGTRENYENGVILPSTQNETFYVSADLLANVFCNNSNINQNNISLTLAGFTSTTEKVIVGTVTLASGTASEDLIYSVNATGSNTYSTNVKILKGQSSAAYRLAIYSADSDFILSCTQLNANDVNGYAKLQYYSYKGTVASKKEASKLAISGNVTANFLIANTVNISGDLTGEGEGYIIATDNEGNVIDSTSFYSDGSTDYSLYVPTNTQSAFLRYKIYSDDGNIRYGYYGDNETTAFDAEAAVLDLSLAGIFNMDILTGSTISGTLNWSNSSADICTIKAMTLDGKYVTDANVYTSSDSTFSILVPDLDYTKYVLVINTNGSSFSKYASGTGLTNKLSNATVYNVSTGDITNASVTVDSNAEGKVIYGVLKLPEGLVASSDIPVKVYAGPFTKNSDMSVSVYSVANTYSTEVSIPTGQSQVEYELDLGTDYAGEKIALAYKATGTEITTGYFDGYSSTVFSTNKDISFNANLINNIDMYVLTNSATDITAIKDENGNEFTNESEKSNITVTLTNLTNIDRLGKIFVGGYDNVNTLIATGVSEYAIDGSVAEDITISIDGNTDNVKFLKIITLDSEGKVIAKDLIIL